MSIVVRGIKMPSSCEDCKWCGEHFFTGDYMCKIKYDFLDENKISKERPDWCPLIELPEHHGDLIDRKDVLDACEFIGERPTVDNPYSENYACRSEIIENIPAVIEQED